ncbi:uncharacterized protein LTR77_009576 [Saxophila tyrrhenica]|uniref:Calcofluor white hypersensitive protein n=1 Tax=Saxophila tyrrhenica TaxID=1690608 RepID=A0AAV9NYL7_9PEZI|nr:hypothetical protein LTR77_009576 [Saxophila tyrrhenica]
MSRRAIQVGGGALAAGVGYYFYKAGGDPQAAQKRMEADATKASNEVKSHLPGSPKEAKKDTEVVGADVSAKANQMAKDARKEVDKVDGRLDQYRANAEVQMDQAAKKTGNELNKAVDKFDKGVTEGADKAKSGISSWFGGSK